MTLIAARPNPAIAATRANNKPMVVHNNAAAVKYANATKAQIASRVRRVMSIGPRLDTPKKKGR
jgi:hypothetical protein